MSHDLQLSKLRVTVHCNVQVHSLTHQPIAVNRNLMMLDRPLLIPPIVNIERSPMGYIYNTITVIDF